MALQIRRGTNAERQLIIPLQGELIFTTDTKKLFIGDGISFGGVVVDTTSEINGSTTLNGLTDVNIATPTIGQTLTYDGTSWVNGSTTITMSDDLTPSLGGNLNTNGFDIISAENTNLTIRAGLNGNVKILGDVLVEAIIKETGPLVVGSRTNEPVIIGSPSRGIDGNLLVVRETFSPAFGEGFTFAQHHNVDGAVDFSLYRSRGTAAAPLACLNGDRIADIAFVGYTGTVTALGAAISAIVDGEPTSTHVPMKLRFGTSNGIVASPKAELTSGGVWQVNSITGLTSTLTLTAGVNISSFLQLPVYVNDTVRNSALTTPTAGMVIFMQTGTSPAATNQIQFYNGTGWVTL